MAYTEACGSESAALAKVATGGINTKATGLGFFKELFYAKEDFSFSSITAMKDQSNWDAGVAAGNLIYLGSGKFEDQSVEQTFFEDTDLSIKIKQTERIEAFRFILAICACSISELTKMEGTTGRLFIRTSNGYVIGRMQEDGSIKGKPFDDFTISTTIPVNATPVRYTNLDFTMSDYKGDLRNALEAKTTFSFADVDQVFALDGVVDTVASNGTNLTFNLTLTQGCSDTVASGLVKANLKVTDVNGNDISTFTVTESGSTGVYAIDVTTALTTVYIESNSIVSVSDVLFVLDQVKAEV